MDSRIKYTHQIIRKNVAVDALYFKKWLFTGESSINLECNAFIGSYIVGLELNLFTTVRTVSANIKKLDIEKHDHYLIHYCNSRWWYN